MTIVVRSVVWMRPARRQVLMLWFLRNFLSWNCCGAGCRRLGCDGGGAFVGAAVCSGCESDDACYQKQLCGSSKWSCQWPSVPFLGSSDHDTEVAGPRGQIGCAGPEVSVVGWRGSAHCWSSKTSRSQRKWARGYYEGVGVQEVCSEGAESWERSPVNIPVGGSSGDWRRGKGDSVL